ncbi:ESF1 homolog isoform X1 [Eucalyptus grandis]|uniref:Uncharacterized protein n=2 Tax=Eucalyptus grandis TaxID=71139 RepID=A0ACC3JIA5_EUCGR|nr:ESF1 homolog isoform X1 [Eucalyptus grandis]KAK3413808.1 hypothetical protein EUGRSUZ_I02350 [Eucalyptus grandis]
METPSSNRRVTRSQTATSNGKNLPMRKLEDSDLRQRTNEKQQQQDRSALIDITNDSPIVGVAAGNSLRTPSSLIANKRSNRAKSTPGSGEALLRGQVKILLQKVEEEAVLSRASMENRPLVRLQGLVNNSPVGLLAPTPANTPQVLSLSDDGSMNSGSVSSIALINVEEQLISQQVVSDIFDGKEQESLESQKSIITRSLLSDFYEKSELSDSSECTSVLTCLGGPEGESGSKEKSSTATDDDSASVWSIQVNASAHGEDEDDEDALIEEEGGEEEEEEAEEDEYEEEDGSLVDELCQGMSKMWVNGEKMPEFAGSHTRFVYNSDDEIVGEEEEGSGCKGDVSPGIVRLKGLPTPRGKHMRFAEEENAD